MTSGGATTSGSAAGASATTGCTRAGRRVWEDTRTTASSPCIAPRSSNIVPRSIEYKNRGSRSSIKGRPVLLRAASPPVTTDRLSLDDVVFVVEREQHLLGRLMLAPPAAGFVSRLR